jgi:hypothetical protein
MSEDLKFNRRLARIEDQIDAILGQLSAQKKEKPTAIRWVNDVASLFATIFAAIAGTSFVLYALGFIIVNVRLGQFGVQEFQTANLSYLPAGLAFLFIGVFVPAWLIGMGLSTMGSAPDRSLHFVLRAVAMLLLIPCASFALTVAILIVLNGDPTLKSITGRGMFGISLYALATSLISFVILLIGTRDVQKGSNVSIANKIETGVGYLGLIGLIPVLLAGFWSIAVYPFLSPAVGGGRAIGIQLSTSDPINDQKLRAIGIAVDSESHVTEPVFLLNDANESLIIGLSDGSVARIDRKLINSIRYLGPNVSAISIVTTTLPITNTPTVTAPTPIAPP